MRAIFLYLLFIPALSFAGGFSSWSQTTPGKNGICYDDGKERIRILCYDKVSNGFEKQVITNITSWYFKPDFIIGESNLLDSNNQINGRCYFIFKESTCDLQTFVDKVLWTHSLEQKNLKATLWKRSHHWLWGFYNFDDLRKFFLLIYFGIPFILIYTISIIISGVKHKFRLDNFITILNMIIGISMIILLVLDRIPYSL